jgi:hypothetical protein
MRRLAGEGAGDSPPRETACRLDACLAAGLSVSAAANSRHPFPRSFDLPD